MKREGGTSTRWDPEAEGRCLISRGEHQACLLLKKHIYHRFNENKASAVAPVHALDANLFAAPLCHLRLQP
jgi:hypothetical protein